MQTTEWRTPVLHVMSSGHEAELFPDPKDLSTAERSLCDTSNPNPVNPEDCENGYANTQDGLAGAS